MISSSIRDVLEGIPTSGEIPIDGLWKLHPDGSVTSLGDPVDSYLSTERDLATPDEKKVALWLNRVRNESEVCIVSREPNSTVWRIGGTPVPEVGTPLFQNSLLIGIAAGDGSLRPSLAILDEVVRAKRAARSEQITAATFRPLAFRPPFWRLSLRKSLELGETRASLAHVGVGRLAGFLILWAALLVVSQFCAPHALRATALSLGVTCLGGLAYWSICDFSTAAVVLCASTISAAAACSVVCVGGRLGLIGGPTSSYLAGGSVVGAMLAVGGYQARERQGPRLDRGAGSAVMFVALTVAAVRGAMLVFENAAFASQDAKTRGAGYGAIIGLVLALAQFETPWAKRFEKLSVVLVFGGVGGTIGGAWLSMSEGGSVGVDSSTYGLMIGGMVGFVVALFHAILLRLMNARREIFVSFLVLLAIVAAIKLLWFPHLESTGSFVAIVAGPVAFIAARLVAHACRSSDVQ